MRLRAATGTTAGTWYGVVIDATATSASMTNVILEHSIHGVRSSLADCTVDQNGSIGIYANSSSSARTVRVTNSIVTNNNFGLYRNSFGTFVAAYSDVWNNPSGNDFNGPAPAQARSPPTRST